MSSEIKETIRAAGFRATRPRVHLYTHLARAKRPQSIQDIFEALKDRMDQVTVYRIVDSFVQKGIMRQIDLRQGRPFFEISDIHDHHHVVCVKCARVEDFTGCLSEKITAIALAQVKDFAEIKGHAIELFGRCKNCIV